MGQFLQVDPVGNVDDFNLYGYVGNDPINETDPAGLCTGSLTGAVAYCGEGGSGNGNGPNCDIRCQQAAFRANLRNNVEPGVNRQLAVGAAAVVGSGLTAGAAPAIGAAVLGNAPAITQAAAIGADIAAPGAGIGATVGLGIQNPLFKDAVGRFNQISGMSKVGRALTKHPEVVGATKDTIRQTLRTTGALNQAENNALKSIMRTGVTSNPNIGRYGAVTEIKIPGGFGARWNSSGKFIGFINP